MAYFEQTKITNISGNVINPAEQQTLYTTDPPNDAAGPVVRTQRGSVDDQITLLRRILKLLESQAATDPQQRQRIVVDAALPTGANSIGTVVIGAGTASIGNVATVASVTNIANVAGWNQQIFADPARTAYNTGIRAQLTFT